MMNQAAQTVALHFKTGSRAGQTFNLSKQVITLGRDSGCDVVIESSDVTVSRGHAQLFCDNGQWIVKNVSQGNYVTVNQQQIQGQQTIRDRDIIGLGPNNTFLFSLVTFPLTLQQPPIRQQLQPQVQVQVQPQPQPVLQTERAVLSPTGSFVTQRPSFEISTNTNQNKRHYAFPDTKQVINIGRDPSNDVVIDELVISGFHAQIKRVQNQWMLVHPHPNVPQTTNGLLYKGRHIKGNEAFTHTLTNGDVFRIGNEYGTLVTLTYNDGSGQAQVVVPDIPSIALGAPEITIGRLPTNTVQLNHPQISGRHARLVRDQGSYRIIDMGSTNHVYVNGQRISNHLLNVNDVIVLGPYKMVYNGTHLVQQDSSHSIRIDAISLHQVGNKQTVLINDLSLTIPSGKFVAIVGGSGAGKSTLMDALNGLRPAKVGHVLYNGQDYYSSRFAFSTQLGYVPQSDIIHKDLTVKRALYFTAKLRLPGDFTDKQISDRIDEVLEAVEMKHRRDLLVSKLSGGQQKRVSIALELLAKPSVFFLDEPTSGLDPGLDRKMMLLLRNLADREGHTIILVTHATNNINNCDYVCFLAQGGRLAYFGPPDDAKAFFGQSDFADIYSSLEPTEKDKDIPATAEARFKASQEYRKYIEQPRLVHPTRSLQPLAQSKRPNRSSSWKQFTLLSTRYIELLKNDIGNLLILMLQAPIVSIILYGIIKYLLGTGVFDTATPGVDAEKTLFIMAFAAVFIGCNSSAREIVKEEQIYRRERTVNLGIGPYMLSKVAVLSVLCLIQCLIMVVVVNAISPFRAGIFLPAVMEIYITLALTSLSGLMTGLAISALAPNSDRANSFIPIILIPQVIFSGIIFKLDGFAQILGGLFSARWAMAGMGSSIDLNGASVGADDFSFQFTFGHLILTWFMLSLMIVVLGGATAYFLKRKDIRVR